MIITKSNIDQRSQPRPWGEVATFWEKALRPSMPTGNISVQTMLIESYRIIPVGKYCWAPSCMGTVCNFWKKIITHFNLLTLPCLKHNNNVCVFYLTYNMSKLLVIFFFPCLTVFPKIPTPLVISNSYRLMVKNGKTFSQVKKKE